MFGHFSIEILTLLAIYRLLSECSWRDCSQEWSRPSWTDASRRTPSSAAPESHLRRPSTRLPKGYSRQSAPSTLNFQRGSRTDCVTMTRSPHSTLRIPTMRCLPTSCPPQAPKLTLSATSSLCVRELTRWIRPPPFPFSALSVSQFFKLALKIYCPPKMIYLLCLWIRMLTRIVKTLRKLCRNFKVPDTFHSQDLDCKIGVRRDLDWLTGSKSPSHPDLCKSFASMRSAVPRRVSFTKGSPRTQLAHAEPNSSALKSDLNACRHVSLKRPNHIIVLLYFEDSHGCSPFDRVE